MVRKWGIGGLSIVVAAVLFIISLFMPWASIVFFSLNGFQQEGYLVFILFIYPVYTVLANKMMKLMIGLASAIFAVLFLIYYAVSMSEEYMGTTFSVAGAGMYTAILSAIILLTGIILKIKETKPSNKNPSV